MRKLRGEASTVDEESVPAYIPPPRAKPYLIEAAPPRRAYARLEKTPVYAAAARAKLDQLQRSLGEANPMTLEELKAAGYVQGLKAAGFKADDIIAVGYTLEEAHTAGFSLREAKVAGYVEGLKAAAKEVPKLQEGLAEPSPHADFGRRHEEVPDQLHALRDPEAPKGPHTVHAHALVRATLLISKPAVVQSAGADKGALLGEVIKSIGELYAKIQDAAIDKQAEGVTPAPDVTEAEWEQCKALVGGINGKALAQASRSFSTWHEWLSKVAELHSAKAGLLSKRNAAKQAKEQLLAINKQLDAAGASTRLPPTVLPSAGCSPFSTSSSRPRLALLAGAHAQRCAGGQGRGGGAGCLAGRGGGCAVGAQGGRGGEEAGRGDGV